ncbi:MAG: flagellar assembly factor FliW [Bryobacteraceae bacterium]|nr:MAG: flagellar assembly factor FliW [Bryobacteraceae bacterium]
MAEPSSASPCVTTYRFPFGIPAFEHLTSFRLVTDPAWAPLAVLESESEPPVRFACAPVALLMPDYRLELSSDEKAALKCPEDQSGLLLYAILTFPQSGPPTANLLAPVVLNPETRLGVQSVQAHFPYSHLHPLRQESPCL